MLLSEIFLHRKTVFCEGDFELIQKAGHYSITMTGYSKIPNEDRKIVNDKILIMGFNPDNTETPSYIGGAALSSSLSKGSLLAGHYDLSFDNQRRWTRNTSRVD